MLTLRPIPGTANYLIRRENAGAPTVLVAEVVEHGKCYSLYRMDATGVLAEELPTPSSALRFYDTWHSNRETRLGRLAREA